MGLITKWKWGDVEFSILEVNVWGQGGAIFRATAVREKRAARERKRTSRTAIDDLLAVRRLSYLSLVDNDDLVGYTTLLQARGDAAEDNRNKNHAEEE